MIGTRIGNGIKTAVKILSNDRHRIFRPVGYLTLSTSMFVFPPFFKKRRKKTETFGKIGLFAISFLICLNSGNLIDFFL